MKIRTKLQALAVVPILAFCAAMALLAVLSLRIDRIHREGSTALTISRKVSDLITLSYEYGITSGERARTQWTAQYRSLEVEMKDLSARAETPAENNQAGRILAGHRDASGRFAELTKFDAAAPSAKAGASRQEIRSGLVDKTVLALQDVLAGADALYEMEQEKESTLNRTRTAVIMILFFIIILVLPPLLLKTVKTITNPIDKLHQSMDIIAAGNLKHRSNIESRDELGTLAQGLNEMAERLMTTIVSRDDLQKEAAERTRMEDELRASEAQLREAQRLAHIGSWDWDAVKDVIWWSEEYYRIYGLEPGTPTPNYEEHLKVYTRESAERLDAAVKRAMETGIPYELDLELAVPTAATRWIVARGEVKRDGAGTICGLRGTAQTITERKLAEVKLKHAGAYNRSLIEAGLDLLVTIDADGKITDVNAATEAVTGRARAELIGTDFSDYFIEPEKARAGYQRVFRDGTVHDYALELRHRDGHVTSVLYNASVYRDESGNVLGVFAAARDVTERIKAEEEIRKLNEELEQKVAKRTADLRRKSDELKSSEAALMNIVEDLNEKTGELEQANVRLQELDRLKSLFIASMSHELRTPLNSIIGFSSIMLNEWTGPLTAEQKENLDAILRSGKHLLALINDVIDVSKIEAGKLEFTAEAFDAYDVAQETATAFRPDIEKKGIALQVRACHQQMRADRRRLLQCLLNLVSNAVKYTDKGAISLDVCLADGDRCLEFGVRDTGIGLKPEDLQKLFSPFVRIITPMRQLVPGTGLGLYLTKKLAREVLNGDIFVESVYGEGSRFVLKVPVDAERRQA